MNSYWFSLVMSCSIFAAGIIGVVKYKMLHSAYRPFIWIMWVGIFNEVLSAVLIHAHRSNAINANLYVLIESLLFTLLFYKWKTLSPKRAPVFAAFLIALWCIDNLILHDLTSINAPFRALASFLIVFFSLDELNHLLARQRFNLLSSGRFIIVCALIFFFAFKSFVEIFYSIPVRMSENFYRDLFSLLVIINCITNILFTIACLQLPKKPVYILRS